MNPRKTTLGILRHFDEKPGALEPIIHNDASFKLLDYRDRRFVYEMVFGIMRRKKTLDYIIKHFLADSKEPDPELLRILRLGAYQIIYMDKIPAHAAVNESVKSAKSTPSVRHASGVVNAVLRRVISSKRNLPVPGSSQLGEKLSIQYSHPAWMVERWLARYGLGKTKKLLEFNNQRPQTYLRRNLRGLSKQQFEMDSTPICGSSTGFNNLYYPLKKHIMPERIALLREGWCTIQAPSSGWVVAMMSPEPGQSVYDMCAAPGGKTSLMAEMVGATGAVCASDSNFARLGTLVENLERLKIRNTYVFAADGRRPCVSGQFDSVLIDAPCTATGVFHRHPEARWLRRKSDIEQMSLLQGELLNSAAELVVPGGTLTYATCSLEPEENDEAIARFLALHPEFSRLDPPRTIPARYLDLSGYLRILPHEHDIDGMFAARLSKKRK